MKVSIIIPVYEVAPYIVKCLKSVMGQTYTGSMECLLIDDCGADDSIAIANRMIADYDGPIRFKVVRHECNRGLSAARNTGLICANGDYVFFLDSDDEITDNCIDLLMEKAEEDPALELVQGTVRTYPVKNLHKLTPKVTLTKVASNEDARKCYYHMGQLIVAAWNKLIKRSFLIKHSIFFIEGVIYEDTPWMFIMLKHLKSISFVGTVSYYYKLRSKSIVTSSTSVKKAESFRKNYHEIITNLTPYHEHEEVMYYARKFSYFYARYSFLDTGYKELMKKWIEKSREYGNWGIRLRLGLSRIFGRIRYGWLLLSLLFRIEEPSLIPIDIRRLLYRFNLIRS